MIMAIRDEDDDEEFAKEVHGVSHEPDQKIFLDSCASRELVIVNNTAVQFMTNSVEQKVIKVGLTGKGLKMDVERIGHLGALQDVYLCPNSTKNICSVSRLNAIGYVFTMGIQKAFLAVEDTNQIVLNCHLEKLNAIRVHSRIDQAQECHD